MAAPQLITEPEQPRRVLERGVDALVRMQRDDGSWEGECVWCPMLTAQYVMTAHILGLELSVERREGILRHFRVTRNERGVWGLHPHDEGSLFVTTLVYVAARLLGALATETWLEGARHMFEREGGVQRIPTWGKVWLAFLDLYGWEGVQPMLPEAWALPSWFPLHPGNYYCHTRSIYLGLAVLYAERFVAPNRPITGELRAELYPCDYAAINFSSFVDQVREADAPFRPSPGLEALFAVSRACEPLLPRAFRLRLLRRLRKQMRRDLRASDYLSLSPVNGLLTIVALFAGDPESPELHRAIERFDAWFWEDSREGSRVAGAGSVCWDTSFALQALAALPNPDEQTRISLNAGADFLAGQQIEGPTFDYLEAHRIDPTGGWCFSDVAHGWPVSDCTAEALLALLHAQPPSVGREQTARATRFILRCQNPDGGFGSYEPAKTRFPLEWMNPSEMFGRCMTERSYVECTASCLVALREVQARYPNLLPRPIEKAIVRATRFLLDAQNPDGTWEAAWGVHYVYATMFGVRGLLAAGLPRTDGRIRRACEWLLAHQRTDGGWGERQPVIGTASHAEANASLSVQTAWALITLLEATEPDHAALERAARCLEAMQLVSGQWPDGQFVGVFFETALLSYRLYRQYFPVMALALYQRSIAGQAPPGRIDASTPSSTRR